jgi:hypothetical protein
MPIASDRVAMRCTANRPPGSWSQAGASLAAWSIVAVTTSPVGERDAPLVADDTVCSSDPGGRFPVVNGDGFEGTL